MSEMKDKLLQQRQQQQQYASVTTGVGTRDRQSENSTTVLSQAFLNSLATPVNAFSGVSSNTGSAGRSTSKDGATAAAVAVAAALGSNSGSSNVVFPAIGGPNTGRGHAFHSQDDDLGDGDGDEGNSRQAHAAWARNQGKASKKSRKASFSGSTATNSSR